MKKIVLVTICVLSMASILFFLTPLFYSKVHPEPVEIFFSISEANKIDLSITVGGQQQSTFGAKQKYPINDVRFNIFDVFRNSGSEFQIGFQDFTHEIDLWDDIGNGTERFNKSKAQEYERNNVPDFLIRGTFIEHGFVPVWSQIWQSQPTITVSTLPFVKRTEFGTWEGEYFFDTRFSGVDFNGEHYITAEVKKITFELNIPANFQIDAGDNVTLEEIADGYLLRKELEPGKNFHIIVQDLYKEKLREIIKYVSPVVFSISLGLLAAPFFKQEYDKRKNKKRRR